MTLLFYDDRPVFGGHEATTLLGIESLLSEKDIKIHFIACEENTTLLKALHTLSEKYPNLTVEDTDERANSFESLRHFFSRGRIADLAAIFRRINPDAVISVQGGIEPSSLGILAAKKCGIKAISYLAMPHSYRTSSAKLSRLLEWSKPKLIERPDAFITSCDVFATQLRESGARGPVEVVFPGIDTDYFVPADKDACREELGLPAGVPLFACVARIELAQKQQDRLLRAIARPELSDCHLILCGKGPDSDEIDQMIKSKKLGDRVRRLSFVNSSKLYPAVDALIIPSSYEGVPLVMLEALSCGTPVIGADRDGMRDILPEDYLMDASSSASVAKALRGFLDRGMPKPPESVCSQIRDVMSLEGFKQTFRKTVIQLVEQEVPAPEVLIRE